MGDGMDKWKQIIKRTIEIFFDNKMGIYSGNATLFVITAAFPFTMLIITLINMLPGYSPEDVANVFFKILPDLGPIHELVLAMIRNLRDQSGGLLASAAALTTLWSASVGVGALQKGLNQLDPAIKENGVRSLIKRILFTQLLIIFVPAFLVFEVLSDTVLDIVKGILEHLELTGGEKLEELLTSIFHVSAFLTAGLALLAILLIFAKLPATKHTLKSQLPGGIFTGIGWYIFTELFTFFIPRFYHASKLYGSLASLFVALLWIRFTIMILFGGAALNHAMEEYKRENADSPEASAEEKENDRESIGLTEDPEAGE